MTKRCDTREFASTFISAFFVSLAYARPVHILVPILKFQHSCILVTKLNSVFTVFAYLDFNLVCPI